METGKTICTEAEERAAIMAADGIETPQPAPIPTAAPPESPATTAPAPASDQDPLANADAECNAPEGMDLFDDFPEEVPPEEDIPEALLRGLFMMRGYGAFLVSTDGVGKSVLVTQAAMRWCAGLDFFGVAPVRPLRIAMFQAENNKYEVARFRNGVLRGAFPGKARDEVRALLGGRLRFYDLKGLGADGLCSAIRALMHSPEKPDMVIIDPLVALCGDWNDQAFVSDLFYRRFDALMRKHSFGLWIVAHTGKIDPRGGMKAWRDSDTSEYALMGSSILADYARAMLLLLKTEAPGFFLLRAAKRGAALDWRDAAGKRTNDRVIAWSREPGVLYWREPEPGEYEAAVAEAKPRRAQAKPAEKDIHLNSWRSMTEGERQKAMVEVAEAVMRETAPLAGAATGGRLREIAYTLFGKAGNALAARLAEEAFENGDAPRWLHGVHIGYKNTSIFALSPAAARAAAEAYMARVRAGKVGRDDAAEGGTE